MLKYLLAVAVAVSMLAVDADAEQRTCSFDAAAEMTQRDSALVVGYISETYEYDADLEFTHVYAENGFSKYHTPMGKRILMHDSKRGDKYRVAIYGGKVYHNTRNDKVNAKGNFHPCLRIVQYPFRYHEYRLGTGGAK